MFNCHRFCLLWLWLFPLTCKGTVHFTSFKKGSVVQEGDLRLAGSSRESEGRVEIFHDGQWGTVCDDGWDIKEARVVCRQLKFLGAKSVVTGEEIYGKASGPIWMDDTECDGTERYLHACKFKGWGVTDCSHKEDIGVVCDTAEGTFSDMSHTIDHRVVLSDEMSELFRTRAFCDLSITAQSSSSDDKATFCGHKAILSNVESFHITENTTSVTVQVIQSCLSHFSSFIRYLYTRNIEVSFSSVQCLHWLSSKFGVDQLRRDTSLLFNQILPDDSSFETAVSIHEYAAETEDLVLQEICAQYMAWNFQNFSQTPVWTQISVDLLSSLLVRSDLVVPEEWFVLKAVENWILNNVNISLDTRVKLISLVRFPMIPAENLATTYMLANSSIYSTHKDVFDENMLKGLQFHIQLFSTLQSKGTSSVDDLSFQPRIYTLAWSMSFDLSNTQSYNGQTRSMSVPYLRGMIFRDRRISWVGDLFVNQYQCSNRGFRCPSLPMARLSSYDSNSQPGVVFRNRLLMMCEDRYVSHIQDFKDNVAFLSKNATDSVTYPCRDNLNTLIYVVRPEFI